MKKLISLLLVVVILTALVGCSGLAPKGKEVSRGTTTGNVYKNEFIGIEFTKPASWEYYTDEQIADLMNIAAENLLDDKFKDALENTTSIYDMMVTDASTGTNIIVSYENLKKTFSATISMEKYIETLKNQLSEVENMTVTFPKEPVTVKLGEVEFTRLETRTQAYGTTMTQVYYLRKESGYMTAIIATLRSGYTIEQIEGMFD